METRQAERIKRYRGRFAPSPTGSLHLGSLFTALAGFLQAKSFNGDWLLRIDDVDPPRKVRGASESIKRTLEKFGLCWDRAVTYQSQESNAYQAALKQLDAAGRLYRCSCSRKTLATNPQPTAPASPYPGTCRLTPRDQNQPHALRVMTDAAVITLDDSLQGLKSWDVANQFGDFIVLRRDLVFAYHLATVVDDGQAGITEVLRGCDLLESTPLQIHLQNLLGLPTPNYQHIPIIVDRHGAKLSKQNSAMAIEGLDPALVLFTLLELLQQSPPVELINAPVAEILDWAIAHWDASKLKGMTAVLEPDWLQQGK